ncbi:diacylglycerol kinase family protein [Arcticibacterium luteifluviistationis]|uniref:Diacylglycerol kinase n=1 Tax=Arcticibacterium luteifluviistationis TaxID=1784714 RepID=A0A2Z4GE66_9BACT|nr:diacylglycerol kinase family protein [Arcticibacterium luteifluviistationis]AWV99278.1 diacylglycerol kinase [Arcticibacterium luteifluviistationis]
MNVKKMVKSFSYAGKGFKALLGSENNFQFHFLAATLVVLAGFYFEVSRWEWAVLLIQIALVFSAEAFNTAIEKLCDVVSPEWDTRIGQVKDIAAAGVLIVAMIAVCVAVLIFGEKILALF